MTKNSADVGAMEISEAIVGLDGVAAVNINEPCKDDWDRVTGENRRLVDENKKLRSELNTWKQLAGEMRNKFFESIHHYECEDGWYSCPLSEGGCLNEAWPKNKCNCGAAEKFAYIARFDSAVASMNTPTPADGGEK
jgi:hypothetical protein